MKLSLSSLGDCLMYGDDGSCQLQGTDLTATQGDCIYGVSASGYCNPAPVQSPVSGTTYSPTGPVASNPTGSVWGSLVNIFGGVASNVGKVYATRNAVPQLNQGESITQLANGTFQITQNASGIATGGSLSLGTSASLTGMMPLLLGAGLLLLLMNKK